MQALYELREDAEPAPPPYSTAALTPSADLGSDNAHYLTLPALDPYAHVSRLALRSRTRSLRKGFQGERPPPCRRQTSGTPLAQSLARKARLGPLCRGPGARSTRQSNNAPKAGGGRCCPAPTSALLPR